MEAVRDFLTELRDYLTWAPDWLISTAILALTAVIALWQSLGKGDNAQKALAGTVLAAEGTGHPVREVWAASLPEGQALLAGERLGLPIPLGGTSNHFRTDYLRELGGWDPARARKTPKCVCSCKVHRSRAFSTTRARRYGTR